MVTTDHLQLAVNGIRKRSLRSWLTIIGIFIGITALVSLISLGQGLQTAINEQFQKLGTNKVIVSPGGFGPPGAFVLKLNDHDLNLIKRTKGVDLAAGMTQSFVSVKFKKKVQSFPVMGLVLTGREKDLMSEGHNLEAVHGRLLKNGDKKKAVVGYDLAYDDSLFEKTIKVGDNIQIKDLDYEVVGVAKKKGNPLDDRVVFVPINDAFEITGAKNKFDFIYVQTSESIKPAEVAAKIKNEMRRDRGLKKGEENFGVQTLESISNAFGNVLFIVQAVIFGIAAISLVVGGVGIMNTMYTAVVERTKEIGIMKSVGGRNSDIMLIFLFESGLLGLIGGILGIFSGFLLSKSVEVLATQVFGSTLVRAVFPLYLILGSLLFSFIIGAASGVFPAYQASTLKPVDALRYS